VRKGIARPAEVIGTVVMLGWIAKTRQTFARGAL